MLIFNQDIRGITDDSRKVGTGFLFVAIKGLTVNGHKYIPQAIENGAKVIVGEEELKLKNVKYIKVNDSRRELGILASRWYGNPSKKLKIIGVTGTDGKTTTSNLIYWILKKSGKKVGLISTVNAKIGNKEYDTGFHVTNPEPLLLQKLLTDMVKSDCKYVVLEVTSHGLGQERIAGIDFDISVLTNITHEHLDYHKTMLNYMNAKAKLFNHSKISVLNKEDKSYSKFRRLIRSKIVTYDKSIVNKKICEAIRKRFKEDYNLSNSLAAISVVRRLGIKDKDIIAAIESFPGIVGRLEKIENKRGIEIYVDFAHTPNALEKMLTNLKKNMPKNKKLIAVFGCAGERDVQKRPMMAEVATIIADTSVFTAEDPRSENIEHILDQMEKGVKSKNNYFRIADRGKAISFAIQKLAEKGDTIVICGKGHERSMAYNGVEYPWSDQEAVKLAFKGKTKKIKWKS